MPARFEEQRGARCFVGKVYNVRALDETAAFYWWKNGVGINLQETDRRIVYAVRITVNHCFSAAFSSKISYIQRRLDAT